MMMAICSSAKKGRNENLYRRSELLLVVLRRAVLRATSRDVSAAKRGRQRKEAKPGDGDQNCLVGEVKCVLGGLM